MSDKSNNQSHPHPIPAKVPDTKLQNEERYTDDEGAKKNNTESKHHNRHREDNDFSRYHSQGLKKPVVNRRSNEDPGSLP